MLARPAGILAQRMFFDQHGIADFLQFDGRVAHVALTDGDARILAVFRGPSTPAAAEDVEQQEAAAIFAETIERAAAHVALVSGGYDMGKRRRERLQDGVDGGGQRDAPQANGRARLGADDGALGDDHIQRAETAVMHVKLWRGDRFEGDARGGDAARLAGVERRVGLRIHLREIHRHGGALDGDGGLDLDRLVEIAAIVVHGAFGHIDPIGNLLDDAAHLHVRLIPDAVDAGFHHGAAVARHQFAIATRAQLAGRDLRAHVAKARVGEAHVVVDDLPQGLVAHARFIDLERAHLQALGEDLGGERGAEADAHAADVDPMGAVGGEGHQLAIHETGRIEHHIVEMLPAGLAMVHDEDVAGLEAIKAPALDAVLHGHAEIGEEDGQAAAILRDHAALGVDEPATEVADLIDHHVVGRLAQRIGHFVGESDDGVAHDFDGDGMSARCVRHDQSFRAMSTMRWPASVTVTLSPG